MTATYTVGFGLEKEVDARANDDTTKSSEQGQQGDSAPIAKPQICKWV